MSKIKKEILYAKYGIGANITPDNFRYHNIQEINNKNFKAVYTKNLKDFDCMSLNDMQDVLYQLELECSEENISAMNAEIIIRWDDDCEKIVTKLFYERNATEEEIVQFLEEVNQVKSKEIQHKKEEVKRLLAEIESKERELLK